MNEISDVLALLGTVNQGFRLFGIFMLYAVYALPLLIGLRYLCKTSSKPYVCKLLAWTYCLYLVAEGLTFAAVFGVFQDYEYAVLRGNILLGSHGFISLMVVIFIATREIPLKAPKKTS